MQRFMMATVLMMGSGGVASGQVLGLPVVNNGVPLGVAFGADIGFSNEHAGKGTAVGVRGELGIGLLGVTVAASRFSLDEEGGSVISSTGASLALRLFGGPLIPFRVMVQIGVARWDQDVVMIAGVDGSEAGSPYVRKATHVPVSLGFAATIPVPAFAIKPWVAPRIDILRTNTETRRNFAISGGIEIAMLNGLSLRAAYDRIIDGDSTPAILSVGVGFAP